MKDEAEIGRFVDAAAPALGLDLAAEHRAGIIANLQRLAAIAKLVMEFPLPEPTEPGPLWRP